MAVQILLIKDVDSLGRSGDIVKVKPGYARNYLIPGKFGYVADKNAIRMQERLKQERLKKAIQDRQDAEALAKNFEGLELSTEVKVDHDGHMYGSVSIADIVHLIEQKHQIHLEKRYVQLKAPIKKLGSHKIHLKFNEGVEADFTLTIVEESK